MFRMPSFVCGLSDFRWDMHILPNSFNASLISRILILLRVKIKSQFQLWLIFFPAISACIPLSSIVCLSSFFFFAIFFGWIKVVVVLVIVIVFCTWATSWCFAALNMTEHTNFITHPFQNLTLWCSSKTRAWFSVQLTIFFVFFVHLICL